MASTARSMSSSAPSQVARAGGGAGGVAPQRPGPARQPGEHGRGPGAAGDVRALGEPSLSRTRPSSRISSTSLSDQRVALGRRRPGSSTPASASSAGDLASGPRPLPGPRPARSASPCAPTGSRRRPSSSAGVPVGLEARPAGRRTPSASAGPARQQAAGSSSRRQQAQRLRPGLVHQVAAARTSTTPPAAPATSGRSRAPARWPAAGTVAASASAPSSRAATPAAAHCAAASVVAAGQLEVASHARRGHPGRRPPRGARAGSRRRSVSTSAASASRACR